MENVDIFQDKYAKSSPTASFFSFTAVGDKIQGTFVRRHNVTGDKFRGDCFNYELLDAEGAYHLVNGGKGGTAYIDKEMANLKPGMIIGIELVELRDTGKVNPAKIFKVYWDESLVNKEWLDANQGNVNFVEENTPAPTEQAEVDNSKKIFDLAKVKLGALEAEDAKAKIVTSTGLAFIPQNQTQIIEKLEAMPDFT